MLIVSNCATSAYVHGMQRLFPGWDVRGVIRPLAEQWASATPPHPGFHDFARACDLYVGLPPENTRYGAILPQGIRHVVIPGFRFPGLQPDCFHLRGCPSVLGRTGNLHSRIVVAAFQAGLTRARTEQLFNRLTYEAFGFFDAYAKGKAILIERFAGYGIDLSDSFDRWLARGNFLHSYNHPRIDVFMEVLRRALIAADLLAASEPWRDDDVDITDDLREGIMWPIYPEIAARHGLPGSLTWRRGQSNDYQTLDLDQFVAASFQALSGSVLPDLPEFRDWVELTRSLACM